MLELLKYLDSLHPIEPQTQLAIGDMLKEQVITKGKHWLRTGNVSDRIAFIKKGLVRVYFKSGNKIVCLWYNKESDVVLSVNSFFAQTPSLYAIQAVEDKTLYYITYKQLMQIYEEHVNFNINGRKLLEKYYSLSEMHVNLLLEPAVKRMVIIQQLYPWLIHDARITNKMLAAYLGVSPEYLSRFKNKK